ncbi:putative pentatricopeptide repeat-containing protein, partial [Tanacetum coccineum]
MHSASIVLQVLSQYVALRTQYCGNGLSQYSTTSTQSVCALRTQYCSKALSQYSTTSTQNGEFNEANKLFNEMQESCYLPDSCTYNTIIQVLLGYTDAVSAISCSPQAR